MAEPTVEERWVRKQGSPTVHILATTRDGYRSPCGSLDIDDNQLARIERVNPRIVDEDDICTRCDDHRIDNL